jgi:hypothetical protein
LAVARKPKLPANVSRFTDRHGKEHYRWRYKGRSAYLPGHPSLPESKALLARLQAEKDLPRPINCAAPGSVDDTLAKFYRSSSFLKAGADRQARVRGIFEGFRAKYGADQVADFEWDMIEEILQQEAIKRKVGKRTVGGPVAAYNLHKQLKRFFDHAIKLKLISVNPARLAEGVKQAKGGFHTWSEEEIAQFGKPFTKNGIGNKMREWCDEAGLPHCATHGLRKAAARRAGDLGASNLMLKAAGGWSQDQEVATYTAAADQARLASEIIMRVSAWEEGQSE